MSKPTRKDVSRRGFLGGTLAFAGAMPFVQSLSGVAGQAASRTAAAPAVSYRSLNADEAAFTEKLVNTRCPADHLTADGVTCGLATIIDSQLAGDFDDAAGQPERAALAHLYKSGLAAANQACGERFGVPFDRLAASEAGEFLRDIAAGQVAGGFPLASWSSEVVDPLLTRACFTGPVYDEHGTRMFWKLFGYVSGPARPDPAV